MAVALQTPATVRADLTEAIALPAGSLGHEHNGDDGRFRPHACASGFNSETRSVSEAIIKAQRASEAAERLDRRLCFAPKAPNQRHIELIGVSFEPAPQPASPEPSPPRAGGRRRQAA